MLSGCLSILPTREEMPLTPYQVEFANVIIKTVTKPANTPEPDWKRIEHMFHVLKGRQMGFTEIVLRLIQFFCFSRYAGKNIGIIAATNGKLAEKDLRRFYKLFSNIREVIGTGLKNKKITLINETIIEAFPASEEALTGDTNYACHIHG